MRITFCETFMILLAVKQVEMHNCIVTYLSNEAQQLIQ